MKNLLAVSVLASAFFCLPALGHGESKTGILVDARCGSNLAKDASEAAAHPVSCAIDSAESGYGIIADGRFLRFDDHGNRQATLLLKATPKESNLKVRVGGHFEGDLIKVSELETVE
jgi:hypothetical protein